MLLPKYYFERASPSCVRTFRIQTRDGRTYILHSWDIMVAALVTLRTCKWVSYCGSSNTTDSVWSESTICSRGAEQDRSSLLSFIITIIWAIWCFHLIFDTKEAELTRLWLMAQDSWKLLGSLSEITGRRLGLSGIIAILWRSWCALSDIMYEKWYSGSS